MMDNHFQKILRDSDVDSSQANTYDEQRLQKVLKKISTNSNASNFREFMTKQKNCAKATRFKALCRKTQALADKEDEMTYRQQLQSALSNRDPIKVQTSLI